MPTDKDFDQWNIQHGDAAGTGAMTCFCTGKCRELGYCPNNPPPRLPDLGRVVLQPQGCICPAGSEKTCQGPMCPRKAISFT